MSVSNTQRNYFKGTTLWCEVLAKWDLRNCPISLFSPLLSSPLLSSLPSSPLPFSPCPACQKTAAAKKPLQAKLLPFTLPWIRATGEAFTIPSLEAACTHQMKALGTQGALAWREGMVRAREAAWGLLESKGCGIWQSGILNPGQPMWPWANCRLFHASVSSTVNMQW